MSSALERANSTTSEALVVARRFFEIQLARLNLSQDQVAEQSLEELRDSLAAVNDAIAHPEGFGVLKIKLTASAGVVIVTSDTESHVELGILPLLLERRNDIRDRIRGLELRQEVERIEEQLASTDADPADRAALAEELERKQEEAQSLDKARAEEAERAEAARLRVEIQAKKSEIYQSWLARESVASLVGSVLLILLAVSFIVAMFTGTAVLEVVSSAFLLILGYFFGQAAGRSDRVE